MPSTSHNDQACSLHKFQMCNIISGTCQLMVLAQLLAVRRTPSWPWSAPPPGGLPPACMTSAAHPPCAAAPCLQAQQPLSIPAMHWNMERGLKRLVCLRLAVRGTLRAGASTFGSAMPVNLTHNRAGTGALCRMTAMDMRRLTGSAGQRFGAQWVHTSHLSSKQLHDTCSTLGVQLLRGIGQAALHSLQLLPQIGSVHAR